MRKLTAWIRRNELGLLLTLLALLILIVYLAPNIFIFVGTGERGVIWRRFGKGTDLDTVYSEGMHIIFPWDLMTIYDTRNQVISHLFDTLSKSGLTVQVEATVRFEPDRRQLGYLHEYVGPEYVDKVVVPEVGAALRAVVARFEAEDLYNVDRLLVQREVVRLAKAETAQRYVFLDDVELRSVTLPLEVQRAIEVKLAEQQRALQYQFILQREAQEKVRKRIEAEGIRDFQQIVANGISEEYLQWRGIEATLQLATSSNAKVVIIGSTKNGLPIILNTDATVVPSGNSGAVAPTGAPAGVAAVPPPAAASSPTVVRTARAGVVTAPSPAATVNPPARPAVTSPPPPQR